MHPDYDYCKCEDTLSHREAVRLSDLEYAAVLQTEEIVTTQAERCVVARCSNPTVNPQRCYYSPNGYVDVIVKDGSAYLVFCTFHAELFSEWNPFVEAKPYSNYLPVDGQKGITFDECILCGAIVNNEKAHTEWHKTWEDG